MHIICNVYFLSGGFYYVAYFKDRALLEKAKKQEKWYFILDPQTGSPYVHDGMT